MSRLEHKSSRGEVYPLAMGPLPSGWHRVTWVEDGIPQYMVTRNIVSAVLVEATLREHRHVAMDVAMDSWSNYPPSQHPTVEIKEK